MLAAAVPCRCRAAGSPCATDEPVVEGMAMATLSIFGRFLQDHASTLRGLAIALVGAAIANALHTPLPWLMGPLFATAATRVAGADTRCPTPVNRFGRWVIGLSLGVHFTPEVVDNLAGHWAFILLGISIKQSTP